MEAHSDVGFIAEPFSPANEAEWRRLVERVLDGRPFESLVSTTFEGLKIAPLYQRPTKESARALRQKPGAWTISQRMDHPEPETADQMAHADLIGGADALTLTIAPTPTARGFGVRIQADRDLDATLAEIDLEDIHPFLVISMAISLWLCPLFLIWYVYEAGFKPAIVLLCVALALRLPLIALERLALKRSEWRISICGIVAVPALLGCLALLIVRQS